VANNLAPPWIVRYGSSEAEVGKAMGRGMQLRLALVAPVRDDAQRSRTKQLITRQPDDFHVLGEEFSTSLK
jgi:hypothetical protein